MSKIKKILNIIFEKEEKKDSFKIPTGKHTPRVEKIFREEKNLKVEEKYSTVTEISKHFKVTPAQLNIIFQQLKWSERKQKWIVLTDLGEYHGGKECYNVQSKSKYIRWKKSIVDNIELIKKVEEFKTVKHKSNKEKGEEYESFISEYYKNKGYFVWEHGKEKGRLDQGIDLIVKKDKEIIFIQCKNWNENTKFKIDHVRVKASRAEARQFMLNNPLFKGYKNKFRYTLSSNCIAPSAIKYIEETNGLFDYEIIEMK